MADETSKSKRSVQPIKVGVVTSASRDKTIRVEVSYRVKHPMYGKYIRRREVLHVHDAENVAELGDEVEITQCRPISKTKSWRLQRVVTKAPEGVAR